MRDLTIRVARAVRQVAGRLRRDERGGIGVLVAILFSSGVLLGVAALVIDVGLLYVGQGQLQNGADAAVLAVGRSCAAGYCDQATARFYVGANSPAQNRAVVRLVCGSGGLGPCPGSPAGGASSLGQLTACPPPPLGRNYVDVSVSATVGSGMLPMTFARSLLGSSVTVTSRGVVAACAQATWGPPASASATALTIPYCAWHQASRGGMSYPAVPSALSTGALAPGTDIVLHLSEPAAGGRSFSSGLGCWGAAGQGTFSWIQDQAGNCSAQISGSYLGDSASGRTSAPVLCQQAIANAQASRTFLVVPVYAWKSSQYGQDRYQLAGFGAFVVTGYHLPGLTAPDWLDPAASCGGTDICVNGYFTRTLIPGTGTIGGQDLGASVVDLSG